MKLNQDEVTFYVQLDHVIWRDGFQDVMNVTVGNFTKQAPKAPTGHVVHVTLKLDPTLFQSEVEATVGLNVEGMKAVVKELKDL